MKGKAQKKLTLTGTLSASAQTIVDLRMAYPTFIDAMPFDTMTVNFSTTAQVQVNDDPNQVYGLVTRGAFAYGGLFVWKLILTNLDTVNALIYYITLEQSGK
jgi:hypothetical protein